MKVQGDRLLFSWGKERERKVLTERGTDTERQRETETERDRNGNTKQ